MENERHFDKEAREIKVCKLDGNGQRKNVKTGSKDMRRFKTTKQTTTDYVSLLLHSHRQKLFVGDKKIQQS